MEHLIVKAAKAYAKANGYGVVSFTNMGNGLHYGANISGLPLIQYHEGNEYFYDYGRNLNIYL
tara:strand:+ start:531 stop:719 length:189 start_codon:yes stop_codon:yes gene_type:complete